MPQLTVITGDHPRQIPFCPGSSVRDILDATSTRVRCGCRGNGLCGLCLVQIETGSVNAPTANERVMLQPRQLDQNIRLACQVVPQRDLSVRIISPALTSNWRGLPAGALPVPPERIQRSMSTGYGAAIDLGTTHISLALWDLKQGTRVTGLIGRNPQARYGSDVVTRLIAASECADHARNMARMVFDAIHEAIMDVCTRNGVNTREIVHLAIVGNTPMLAILTGTTPGVLLRPQSWTRELECRLGDPEAWRRGLGLHPEAVVEVVSPFAGFVGSDLLAGVLATDLTARPGGLLIDFGTNSEIALWDGHTLWVTSAAGGPAFEGCGIQCGMPAEPGAIHRVTGNGQSTVFDYHVIDGGQARGICGSGLVDLIACLLRAGRLTPTGKFAPPQGADGFVLCEGEPAIRFDSKGIDLVQRAKAAIGVGIRTLLAKAHMFAGDLTRICVCGVFGQFLDIRNAQEVGLLPASPSGQVELCGNTALGGCQLLLLSSQARAELASIRRRATIVNLAQTAGFDDLFLECLYLRPMEASEL